MGAARTLALVFALACAMFSAAAQDLLPLPALTARVIDQTGALAPPQRDALEAKLADFESRSGPQIVLLLVRSTHGEDIAAFAQRVADHWKIGRRDVGDGLLLVVALDDRRVRIEVAKALEGAVPDLAARQIIDRRIAPAFRQGDVAGGLNLAVDALIARIQGEGLPAPAARGDAASRGFGLPSLEMLGLFFFVAVPMAGAALTALLGRRLGSLATAGAAGGVAWVLGAGIALALVAGIAALLVVGLFGIGAAARRATRGHGPWIGPGGGGFGGGGWSGGGGGFSSGGGGDFGGGGASGSW